MIYFDYLGSAYVQTGVYKAQEFYRNGYHTLQRVGGVGSYGETVATSFPYTVDVGGSHRLVFDATDAGGGTDSTFEIQVNGTAVTTINVTDATTSAIDYTVDVDEGDVISLNITVDSGLTFANVAITREDNEFPESFFREWATFADGRDDVKGYDPGAYGIGTPVSRRTIVVPKVKPVHLLYMNWKASTKEEVRLVQVDATNLANFDDIDSTGLGIVGDTLTAYGTPQRKVFTEEEYIETYAPKGYNRFGLVLPSETYFSNVQELHSYTGSFEDVSGTTATRTVYVEPLYVGQQRPMFDFIYLQAGFSGDLDPAVAGISGHLLRWRGEVPSENIAAINRDGSAVTVDGYRYDVANQQITDPTDVTIEDDGQSYTNADAYNVRNYRRH